ncbi:Transcription initiation protein SPT3 like, partial [Dissostichus eleginoides]
VGQSGVRAAENAYLSVQMAHGGAERVDVSVPCHLRPAVQRVVQRIPPLMKFDILEMTGECVMEVLVISKSTGLALAIQHVYGTWLRVPSAWVTMPPGGFG